jgi:predicted nucleotidyltransferase
MITASRTPSDLAKTLATFLSAQPEIRFAILYGSAAEGGAFRDLDIGVFMDRTQVSADADLDYAFAVADELSGLVPFPVDVRVINDAPLPFRYNVSRGIPLTGREEEDLYTFLERTWDECLDFKPILLEYLRDLA